METTPHTTATVEQNRERNLGFVIYLSFLAVAGVVIMVLGHLYGWGFWGWFGGGLLVFAGIGGLAGMWMTGGAGTVACPVCQHPIDVLHISEHRVIPCPSCGTYLEGAEHMAPVADDKIADLPAFHAPLPAHIDWPDGCPVCRKPATRTVRVEGTSDAGALAGLMLPVSFHRVDRLDVPHCDEHDNGASLRITDAGTVISFRSYSYWRDFRANNPVEPDTTSD